MEQELVDFDEWIKNFQPEAIKYSAVFDPVSGSVLKVGPDYSFDDINKVDLPSDTAIDILEGRIKLHSCFIDPTSEKLEIVEVQSLTKIDDVLHKIVSKEWSNDTEFDVYLTFKPDDSKIIIELSTELGGTKTPNSQKTKSRRIFWDGETEMNFLITDYNDPHIIHETFSVKINDLHEKQAVIIVDHLPKRISVYTRRLFKKYMLETK